MSASNAADGSQIMGVGARRGIPAPEERLDRRMRGIPSDRTRSQSYARTQLDRGGFPHSYTLTNVFHL